VGLAQPGLWFAVVRLTRPDQTSTIFTARIQALGLALLDFNGAEDLTAWLEAYA